MKADSLKIAKVFSTGGDIHYALPHFQREYAWKRENWETLLDDVLGVYGLYSEQTQPEHFLGTLVVINDGVQHGTIPVFRLVDGQQRLTTISLMLSALGRLVKESHPSLYKKIQKLLVNEDEEGHLYYKVLPTSKYGDRLSYQAIISGESPPAVESLIPKAFEYFFKELNKLLEKDQIDPEQFFIVLTTCLQAVFIDLDNNERPYEIFESLNFKGKTLTQADLVRNYIAMKLPSNNQAYVFDEYWSPIEEMLQEKRTVGKSRLGELTAFLRHYMAYLYGVLVNEEHVYSRFRDRGQQQSIEEFIEEIKTLKRFAVYYDRMLRPTNEPDQSLRLQLNRLNILESATAYPFLLFAYEAIDEGRLSPQELAEGLKVIEAYMVRRYLAKEQVGYINRMFPTLFREVDTSDFVDSLRRGIATKNYPSDERVRQALQVNGLYKRDREKLVLVLETINRYLSQGSGGYTVLDGKATLEHIMPQTLSEEWQRDLGLDLTDDYELLHTLGNLTLVTQDWNSAMSNASYSRKKALLGKHALELNRQYFADGPERWNGQEILERGDYLSDLVIKIWPAPSMVTQERVVWSERPQTITILGETHKIRTWRDVVQITAEAVAVIVSDFEADIVSQLPTYFGRNEMVRASRELTNGWWIYVHLSGRDCQKLAMRMIELAGIPEDEFKLTW